jgi:hypothetical protein
MNLESRDDLPSAPLAEMNEGGSQPAKLRASASALRVGFP